MHLTKSFANLTSVEFKKQQRHELIVRTNNTKIYTFYKKLRQINK